MASEQAAAAKAKALFFIFILLTCGRQFLGQNPNFINKRKVELQALTKNPPSIYCQMDKLQSQ
ncbi:hypothetical protein BFS05_05215 [Gardnerella vaginalis]|uniref:Uncharacterized protein n=1 Tax=Gardnerella vaginalis TaxID=2702 RepID=A0A2K1STY2_GARVA|nr:hypothetical protein BFS05_05215 [Gardnerella vaginalis]